MAIKYIAIIGGGSGPDVWDRDIEIDADDFEDAFLTLKSMVHDDEFGYSDAVILSLSQED